MMLKTSIAGLIFFATTTVFAADAPTLKEGVDAGAKSAIESALTLNKTVKAAKMEWIWAKPVNKIWAGKKQSSTKILYQAIEMANSGNIDGAKRAAAFIEMAAKEGIAQAEKRKKAGPVF